MRTILTDHPLVAHKLTTLRDERTDSPTFRLLVDELVTLLAYEATRDLTRMMRAEWHEKHTLPALWRFHLPDRLAHASYWIYWGTEEEVAWKENYKLWMAFINEYRAVQTSVNLTTDHCLGHGLHKLRCVGTHALLRPSR